MFRFVSLFMGATLRLLRHRQSLLLENRVLRQPISALKRKNPQPKLTRWDRCFGIAVSRLWSEWKSSLLLVKPETVVEWHRRGFRIYWQPKSKVGRAGRKPISPGLQQIIFRMASENPNWGAPRIHGELRMLGFDVSERTISRWMGRCPRPDPTRRWLAFLRNHREVIAAMDFFTVPTITFQVLYGFFVLAHDRRRILHCNVTAHPTSAWIVQQLREAFPFEAQARYLIFDRDALRLRRARHDPSRGDGTVAHSLAKSVAQRHGRTVGRKLSPRIARSCNPRERTPPAPTSDGICSLLP